MKKRNFWRTIALVAIAIAISVFGAGSALAQAEVDKQTERVDLSQNPTDVYGGSCWEAVRLDKGFSYSSIIRISNNGREESVWISLLQGEGQGMVSKMSYTAKQQVQYAFAAGTEKYNHFFRSKFNLVGADGVTREVTASYHTQYTQETGIRVVVDRYEMSCGN